MNDLIKHVLERAEFMQQPPVCMDLGASGGLPFEWELLAPYSVCIAFDADDRDFVIEDQAECGWRRLIKVNRLVCADAPGLRRFYLTQSPYCSSSLVPRNTSLKPWEFRELFEINRTVELPAVLLNDVLNEFGTNYIDWFKTDTQGTDLRLFAALPEDVRHRTLAVDFEPGIIDAYAGEDKLHDVLRYMETLPFFVSDMTVKGSRRIGKDAQELLRDSVRCERVSLKCSPCWAEICYLNDLSAESLTIRDLLLAWVFATIKEQHGHAMLAAKTGVEKFADSIFYRCESASLDVLSGQRAQRIQKAVRRSIIARCRRRLAQLIMPSS